MGPLKGSLMGPLMGSLMGPPMDPQVKKYGSNYGSMGSKLWLQLDQIMGLEFTEQLPTEIGDEFQFQNNLR